MSEKFFVNNSWIWKNTETFWKAMKPFSEDIYIDMSVTIIIWTGIRESTIFYVRRNINNQATVGRTWS